MTDWTTCRVVRDKDGDLWMRDAAHGLWCAPGEYFEPDVAELERDCGPLTPVLDAGGLPVVTTVGDLTMRHVGRHVRIDDTPRAYRVVEGRLTDFASAAENKAWITVEDDESAASWSCTLDAPCEVLDA